jgi:hypothetical protein
LSKKFIEYAESKGGKALSDSQKELVSKETSYAGVRVLLAEFKKPKPSSTKKTTPKKEVVKDEE